MNKLLILMNCFFNVSDIERTVISILNTNYPYDIIFLENPSKYSVLIRDLAVKYNIFKHYICSDNIEGNIFQVFCNNHQDILHQYKYIAMTEADVVLDKGSIDEAISILHASSDEIDVISIDLHMNTTKYHNLPIYGWVPSTTTVNSYIVGATGFQFIIFKDNTLNDFIKSINNKELQCQVALGVDNYYGISDSNLDRFIKNRNHMWVRTCINKLDHIGWEHYIENNDEYVQLKTMNIQIGKIRNNIDINNYFLTEL